MKKIAILTRNYQFSSDLWDTRTGERLRNDIMVFKDPQAFANYNAEIKIALIEMIYTTDELNTGADLITFPRELALIQHADHVFVRLTELHPPIIRAIQKFDLPNFTYFLAGYCRMQHAKVHLDIEWAWFINTAIVYLQQPNILKRNYDPYLTKPKTFDVMLGVRRYHRQIVNTLINESPYNQTFLKTPFLDVASTESKVSEKSGVLWEPEIKRLDEEQYGLIEYFGHKMHASQVIPLRVYRQTAYSLVCETNYINGYSFFTEKIVKPILARRLFIVAANHGYLADLRRLGFQTFSPIVDESYDDIEDPYERCCAVVRAAEKLSCMPQAEVLEAIKVITEHNYRVIEEMEQQSRFLSSMDKALQTTLASIHFTDQCN